MYVIEIVERYIFFLFIVEYKNNGEYFSKIFLL